MSEREPPPEAAWTPPTGELPDLFNRLAEVRAERDAAMAEVERLTRRNAELTDSEERMASATRIAESHRRMVCKLAADREAERDTLQARVAELERERDEACRILSLYRVFAQFEFDELRAAMKHLTPAAPGSE